MKEPRTMPWDKGELLGLMTFNGHRKFWLTYEMVEGEMIVQMPGGKTATVRDLEEIGFVLRPRRPRGK